MASIFKTSIATRWLPPRAQALIRRVMARQTDEALCRYFSLYNKFIAHWPVTVEFDGTAKAFRVSDDSGCTILVGRRTRLQYYSRGVAQRLHDLAAEYCVDELIIRPGDLVVDVGANIGEFSMYMQSKGAQIIAIEPEEVEFRCLTANLANDGAVCLRFPLWKCETDVELYSKNDTGDSSLFEIPSYSDVLPSRAFTLKQVLDKYASDRKVRLLKLEAEGAEPEIILGAGEALNNIEYVTVDVGAERGLSKSRTLVPVLNLLQPLGFELVAAPNSRSVLLLKKRM